MLAFEGIFCVATALLLLLWVVDRRYAAAVLVTAVAWLAHVMLDGWRWQMIPAYTVAALFIVLTIVRPTPRPWLRAVAASVATVIWASAPFLAWQLPVLALPAPDGPHPVGTVRYAVIDASREEAFHPDPQAGRELVVEVWYPGSPQDLGGYPAVPLWHELYRGEFDWVGVFTAYLGKMQTHGHRGLPVPAGEQFPLVLYNHGLATFTGDNTLLMEHLASHGYVVVSVSHPHYALRVDLPSSGPQVIDFGRAFAGMPEQDAAAMAERLGRAKTREARAAITLPFVEANPVFNRIVETWVADTRAVLDDLRNRPDLSFAASVDPSRVGVIGMSFGGATAAEFCKQDARCVAGINIDGTQYGSRQRQPLTVPFMMLSSSDGMGQNEFLWLASVAEFHEHIVADAKHADFTDFTLTGPLLRMFGLLGSIPGERMLDITHSSVRGFLDRYLKRIDAPTFDESAFPEVRVATRNLD